MRGVFAAAVGVLVLVLAHPCAGGGAHAQSVAQAEAEEPAARQLRLAEEDLAAGNFERAAAAASSALRLDPALTAALVVRGLALEGVGRLDEARSILKTYADLRGTLALDERVAPALSRLEAALGGTPSLGAVAPGADIQGQALLLLAGGMDDQQAYRVAKPHLGGVAPVAVMPLTELPGPQGIVVLGASAQPCVEPAHDAAALLTSARSALDNLDLDTAASAVETARASLACEVAEPALVERWLRVAAEVAQTSGNPTEAERLWISLFTGFPRAGVDLDLAPRTKAAQLGAYDKASSVEPVAVTTELPPEVSLMIDGSAAGAAVAPGARFATLVGGQPAGYALEVGPALILGSGALLRESAVEDGGPPVLTGWFVASTLPALQAFAVERALIVRADGRVLELTRAGLQILDGPPIGARGVAQAPPVGVPFAIGGGVAAGIGGVLVGTSVTAGKQLAPSMGTPTGWVDGIGDYRSAQTGERAGWATLGVGSAVLVAGLVQAIVEAAGRAERKSAVAEAGRP